MLQETKGNLTFWFTEKVWKVQEQIFVYCNIMKKVSEFQIAVLHKHLLRFVFPSREPQELESFCLRSMPKKWDMWQQYLKTKLNERVFSKTQEVWHKNSLIEKALYSFGTSFKGTAYSHSPNHVSNTIYIPHHTRILPEQHSHSYEIAAVAS